MGMHCFKKVSKHSFEGLKYQTQYDKILSLSLYIITGITELHKMLRLGGVLARLIKSTSLQWQVTHLYSWIINVSGDITWRRTKPLSEPVVNFLSIRSLKTVFGENIDINFLLEKMHIKLSCQRRSSYLLKTDLIYLNICRKRHCK